MDRQDAKPLRPSLLAGAPLHAAAGSPSARILADMDGGKPVTARPRPGYWRAWALPALGLIGLGLIGLNWWLPSHSDASGTFARESPTPTSALGADDADSPMTVKSGTATIIDEPAAQARDDAPGPAAKADPSAGAATDKTSGSPFAGIATATATARAVRAENPFVPASGPVAAGGSRSPRASRLPAAATGGPRNGSEPDLIGTLLHNIQTQPGQAPSGLDTLIRKMEATETASAGKPNTLADAPPRSQQIQANLRECPPPNTARGLSCRQAICAVYAGRDPACPAL